MLSKSELFVKFSRNFTELDKILLKFTQNHKRARVSEVVLGKKNKVGSITLLGFRQYHKATIIKTARY